MKYLLDTHTWIWWNAHPGQLSAHVMEAINKKERNKGLLLSVISIWEFCKLLEKKRLSISCNPEEWITKALQMPGLKLVRLTPMIVYQSTILPQPFHNDPADQIIVASAREENATIVTKDKRILDYPHIKTLW